MQKPVPIESAQNALRTTGARVTQPRIQVLAILLGSDAALSHHQIEGLLAGQSIDRVTVYRVLDWLVGQRLAHRISGQDRVWRFAAIHEGQRYFGHFQCVRCAKVFLLPEVEQHIVHLPRGFWQDHAELTVTGLCADCAA